ncbi:MAG: cytochrome b N-terminal domain-containing protein [Elusimicrobiota bacterium]
MTPPFLLHFLPASIKADSLSFAKTQWAGITALVSFLILGFTGVLLMFFYVPSAEGAYDSILLIDSVMPLGAFTRSLHRGASHLFMLALLAHMLKAFFGSAFLYARQNWYIGLGLFALALLLAYTGYLLPYDQTAYWAVTVGLELARAVPLIGPLLAGLVFGAAGIDDAALTRCYGWHAALGPLLIAALLVFHFWQIRSQGLYSSSRGRKHLTQDAYLPAVGILAGAVVLVCALWALLSPPDIGPRPWLAEPPNPVKAPWYFLGLQELASHATALIAVPGLIVLSFLLAPFAAREKRWKTPFFAATGILLAIVVAATFVGALRGENWQLGAPRTGHGISPSAKYAGRKPNGIIETKVFGRLERCLSCHAGMRHKTSWIDETHPAGVYGCASCHGGTALSLDAGLAHSRGAGWGADRLLTGDLSYASCFRCHLPGRLKGTGSGARGIALLTELGCLSCHEIGAAGSGKNLRSTLYRGLDELRELLIDPARRLPERTMPRYQIFEDEARFQEAAVALLGTSLPRLRKPAVDWTRNCSLCHPRGAGSRPEKFHACPTIKERASTLSCLRCHEKKLKPGGAPCPYVQDHAGSCRTCHD